MGTKRTTTITAASTGLSSSSPTAGSADGIAGLMEASQAMHYLMLRDDGWLRMVPHDHGKVTYWKWKFVSGPWKGHYVMWVADCDDWTGAVVGLVTKIRMVDAGELRPALDRPYDG